MARINLRKVVPRIIESQWSPEYEAALTPHTDSSRVKAVISDNLRSSNPKKVSTQELQQRAKTLSDLAITLCKTYHFDQSTQPVHDPPQSDAYMQMFSQLEATLAGYHGERNLSEQLQNSMALDATAGDATYQLLPQFCTAILHEVGGATDRTIDQCFEYLQAASNDFHRQQGTSLITYAGCFGKEKPQPMTQRRFQELVQEIDPETYSAKQLGHDLVQIYGLVGIDEPRGKKIALFIQPDPARPENQKKLVLPYHRMSTAPIYAAAQELL